ncbi:hypothetical protein QAD02_004131 [Eretmocerus hayati]|uniref:Uncharacterized protein n=1 Tax=Eretmocerus hayati TaxID=131215 RepID=A0ACC2NTJ0_9HYME|nr:hypothetical protein QAD02_004131 [Eretmocerus hayati]
MPSTSTKSLGRLSDGSSSSEPSEKKQKLNDPKLLVSQEMKAISESVEAFSNDIFKVVASDKQENYVSSSLSAFVAMAMVAYGAEGSTRVQMFQGLYLPKNDNFAHLGFKEFLQALNNIPGVILQVANKVCMSKDCKIKDEYKEIIEEIFHSESDSFDFAKATEVVKSANEWCTKNTRGKIKEILSTNDIERDSVLLLLNVVYFNGNWKSKFKRWLTSSQRFHVSSTTTVVVPMMFNSGRFPYKDVTQFNAECISIPYKNEDLSMIILLPKEIDGLKNLEENWEKINSECLNASLFENYQDVNLDLPRFKVNTIIDLKQYLSQLGIDKMFSNEANFKGISDNATRGY